MSAPGEPCRTCDGTGYVEIAPQNSRVLHREPCPDCGGPVAAVAADRLVRALVAEYADLVAGRGVWVRSPYHPAPGQQRIFEQGARAALLLVAKRLGVPDLHEQAAAPVARGAGEEGP